MFLESLRKLKCSYFVDGVSTTKAGLIDCLFLNNPKYLLIYEIDKMSAKDQAMLLNLMETGIVSETKHNMSKNHWATAVLGKQDAHIDDVWHELYYYNFTKGYDKKEIATLSSILLNRIKK